MGQAPVSVTPLSRTELREAKDVLGKFLFGRIKECGRYAQDTGQGMGNPDIRLVDVQLVPVDSSARYSFVDSGLDSKLPLREARSQTRLFQASSPAIRDLAATHGYEIRSFRMI